MVPGLGRSPGEGKDYPLQCSGLGNSREEIVHGVAKSRIRLSTKLVYICKICGGSVVKNLPANARDVTLIPGLGRYAGERSGNPLQYSCLGNSMDRGAWWAVVHGVTKG